MFTKLIKEEFLIEQLRNVFGVATV